MTQHPVLTSTLLPKILHIVHYLPISNGYNEIEREGVLTAIRKEDTLDNTLAFSHALLEPVAYVGMGNGTRLLTTQFLSREGGQQGAVKRGSFFCYQSGLGFQMTTPASGPTQRWYHSHH